MTNHPALRPVTATPDAIEPRTRALLMTVRRALIMILCELEDYLGEPRSIERRAR